MFESSESVQLTAILDQISDPVIIINPELDFILVNKAYCNYMGIDQSKLLSMNLSDAIPAEYRPVLREKFKNLTASHIFFDNIYPAMLEDGSIIVEKWHNEGVFDESGILKYYTCVATIQNAVNNDPLSLKDADLVSNTLIKSALLGIIMSVDDEIIFINKKTYEILGTAVHDSFESISLHKFLKSVFPDNYKEIKLNSNTKNAVSYEIKIQKRDNTESWVSLIQKAQVYNKKETLLYLLEDITERKQNEIEIQKAKNNLSEVMRIAKIGYWEKDYINDCWLWSDEIYEIFNIPKGTLITEKVLADYIVPESKITRDKKIAYTLSGENDSYSYKLENKIRLSKSELKWLSGESYYEKAADGKPARFYGWVQDITNRKQIEEDLRTAKELAEESEQLKTAFLTNMSHEIRTPLNAILGFSDLLTHDTNVDERIKFKKIINQSSRLLLKIIDDILDISTIESGKLELNLEEVLVEEIFQNLTIIFSDESNDNVCLVVEDPKQNLKVHADPERLKQVLINFISNAFKYTIEGCITVSCKPDKRKKIAIFSVKDTGIGIASNMHENIFDRFYQADSFSKGTGLGLAITRSIVEQMGGIISVESTPGEGSDFSFTLPLVLLK